MVAKPLKESSLANAIGRTHFVHTQYINQLHGRRGHLWQNRFYSCALDEGHFWMALRYVERNPVRAKMVRQAWEYPWSSAGAHTGGSDSTGLIDEQAWKQISEGRNWREMLTASDDEETLRSIRMNTRTGRPLGSDRFLSKVEAMLGRRVRALSVGRPKKRKK